MSDLGRNIQAYEAMEIDLHKHHMGKWVVIHDGELVDTFDTLDAAAPEALTTLSGPAERRLAAEPAGIGPGAPKWTQGVALPA